MDPKFKNKLFEHIFQSLKVKLNFVNPYNHNALKVERHIRTLQEQLICRLKQKADLWPNYLTGAAAAHNNTVSVSLGHSPFYLLYMRHPPSPDSFNLEPIQYVIISSNYKKSARKSKRSRVQDEPQQQHSKKVT